MDEYSQAFEIYISIFNFLRQENKLSINVAKDVNSVKKYHKLKKRCLIYINYHLDLDLFLVHKKCLMSASS